MFSHKFQSALVLVDAVLMQMQNFSSHGDLTTKVLYYKIFAYFVLYIILYSVFYYQPSEAVSFCYKSNFLLKHNFYDLCNFVQLDVKKFLL